MTTTQLFNAVDEAGEIASPVPITLQAGTTTINVLLQVETVKSPGLDGVSLFFVTAPYTLATKTIADLKREFLGTIQEVRLVSEQVLNMRAKSGEVYAVDGTYFAAWVETPVITSVKVNAWLTEY